MALGPGGVRIAGSAAPAWNGVPNEPAKLDSSLDIDSRLVMHSNPHARVENLRRRPGPRALGRFARKGMPHKWWETALRAVSPTLRPPTEGEDGHDGNDRERDGE
jgi:hypothetical protein